MEFKPFDDFREARAIGAAAAALPQSNTYKVAAYKEQYISDAAVAANYPTDTCSLFIDDARIQSILIDQRIVAVRITPHIKPKSYTTGAAGDYEQDAKGIQRWMEEQEVTMSVDGVPVLNEVELGSMIDGFTFDPNMMPVPKNTMSILIDHATTSAGASWQPNKDNPVPLSIEGVTIGYLAEIWYTK